MRETMDRLSGAQNRLRNASMVLLAVLAVSVILILMKIRIPGLVLGTAAMVLYFGWVKWQSRKYSGQVTEANILHGLAADLEDPKYLGKKGLTVEELDQAAILPVQVEKGSLLIFQGIRRETGGKPDPGMGNNFPLSPRNGQDGRGFSQRNPAALLLRKPDCGSARLGCNPKRPGQRPCGTGLSAGKIVYLSQNRK